MVSDRKSLQDIIARVDEFAQETRDAIEASMSGTPLGSAPANDREFALFFEQQARKDTDWVRALPFVDGGMDYIKRYEKIRMRGQ